MTLDAPISVKVGTVLAGRYRIDELIGRGSMGAVYRGTQLSVQRSVAIKMVSVALAGGDSWLERFEREAVATSRLSHPNTIRVFDYGATESDDRFLVMELLEGRTLLDAIQDEAPMTLERAVDICVPILEALEQAHQLGIIHRDLKPSNIFLTRLPRQTELVKVLDFGVAKVTEDPNMHRLTNAHCVVGTPYYMSPEQCRDEQLDGRSDIYAVGCLLYEMLVGAPPFQAKSHVDVIIKQISDAAPDVRSSRPDLPVAMTELLVKWLAKHPADRPATAHAAVAALETAVASMASDEVATQLFDVVNEAALDKERSQITPRRRATGRAIPIPAVQLPRPARATKRSEPTQPTRSDEQSALPELPEEALQPVEDASTTGTRENMTVTLAHRLRRKPRGAATPRRAAGAEACDARAASPATAPRQAANTEETIFARPQRALAQPALPTHAQAPSPPRRASRHRLKQRPSSSLSRPSSAPPVPPSNASEPTSSRDDAATLEFEFLLKGHRGTKPPRVRIWVDVNSDRAMDPSEEIRDLQRDAGSWRGQRKLPVASSEGIAFLVRFSASPGVRYRLRVWSDKPKRHLVFEQIERSHEADERIIGWCKR